MKPFSYTLRVSSHARHMRLTVQRDGQVVLTVPRRLPSSFRSVFIEKFIREKTQWVVDALQRLTITPRRYTAHGPRAEFLQYKMQALHLAEERLRYFNKVYGLTYKKVTIRNTKSRWGSCSRQGNLSFTYKIALLPSHLAEYIIVHELCHRGEFNHSKKFWELVAKTIPDHRPLRRELKGSRSPGGQ